MGSEPPDAYDNRNGQWNDRPKMEEHFCTLKVSWPPKGKRGYVSRTFVDACWPPEGEGYCPLGWDTAQLDWLLNDHKGFAKECVAPNVTENDVENIREVIFAMFDAFNGDDDILADLASIRARLYGQDTIDRKRARFVTHVRSCAIAAQDISPRWDDDTRNRYQDKRVESLISIAADRFSLAFAKLDPVIVKDAVMSIDPQSKGKKPGPAWLAARLIDAANAGDDFGLPRANDADKGYFDYVKSALQTAKTPGRSKPKSSAKTTTKRKTTKSSAKKP